MCPRPRGSRCLPPAELVLRDGQAPVEQQGQDELEAQILPKFPTSAVTRHSATQNKQ